MAPSSAKYCRSSPFERSRLRSFSKWYLIEAAVLQLALQVVALGMKPWDHAAWHMRRRRLHVAQMRPVLAAGVQVQVQNRAVLRNLEESYIEVPVKNQ